VRRTVGVVHVVVRHCDAALAIGDLRQAAAGRRHQLELDRQQQRLAAHARQRRLERRAALERVVLAMLQHNLGGSEADLENRRQQRRRALESRDARHRVAEQLEIAERLVGKAD
jgi:hypothetical protein